MGIKYQKFLSNNFFLLILLFATIIIVFLSYSRFIVHQDYIIGYEGVCDPTTEKCFIGHEEGDNGTEEYYYSSVRKYAADLYAQCGKDITDCEAANVCLPEDRECSVTYCETGIDDNICTTPTGESLEEVNVDNTL